MCSVLYMNLNCLFQIMTVRVLSDCDCPNSVRICQILLPSEFLWCQIVTVRLLVMSHYFYQSSFLGSPSPSSWCFWLLSFTARTPVGGMWLLGGVCGIIWNKLTCRSRHNWTYRQNQLPSTHTQCPKLAWLSFHTRIFHSFEAMRKPRVRKRSAGYSPLVATVCAIAAGCPSVVSEWSQRLRVVDLLAEHISVIDWATLCCTFPIHFQAACVSVGLLPHACRLCIFLLWKNQITAGDAGKAWFFWAKTERQKQQIVGNVQPAAVRPYEILWVGMTAVLAYKCSHVAVK